MNKKIVVGILGLPVRKDHKFYLTRRDKPEKPVWHNKWQVAGGGLEFGETPEDTLHREMNEELGLTDIKIIYPQPILTTQIWYGTESDHEKDTQVVLATYLLDIGSQIPDFTHDDETNGGNWFTLEEVGKLDSLPLTPKIVQIAHQICIQNSLWGVLQ